MTGTEQAGYDFLLTLTMGLVSWLMARVWLDWRETSWRRKLHAETRGTYRTNRRRS